jgi:hypothetical protein
MTFQPLDLQTYIAKRLDQELNFDKSSELDQCLYIRDKLAQPLGYQQIYQGQKEGELARYGRSESATASARVISEHRSKSCTLPVVDIIHDSGLTLTVRQNFYNWKLSVVSPKHLSEHLSEHLFDGLCHTTPPVDPEYTGNPLNPVYFEGFPSDKIYGYFSQDRSRFSLELWQLDGIQIALFLIMRELGLRPALIWSSRKKET